MLKKDNIFFKWKNPYIEPVLKDIGIKSKSAALSDYPNASSKYNSGGQNAVTLINHLLKASLVRSGIYKNMKGGCAELVDGKILAMLESEANSDVQKYILYNPLDGSIKGCAHDTATDQVLRLCLDSSYGAASDRIYHTGGAEICMATMQELLADDEAALALGLITDAIKRQQSGEIFDEEEAVSSVYRLCDNYYRRLIGEAAVDTIELNIKPSGVIKDISLTEIRSSKIRSIIWGEFDELSMPEEDVTIDSKKYRCLAEVNWTSKQKKFIPKAPSYWKPTKEGLMILEQFYRSRNDLNGNPVKTIYLEGANGTSKTTLCLYDVAASIGCPAHIFQFSYSTTSADIKGDFIPKTKNETSEKTESIINAMPSEIEAELNPKECWRRLLMLAREITPSMVNESLFEMEDVSKFDVLGFETRLLKEHLKAEGEDESSVNFEYVPSPIVEALTGGGVLILDEITCLANPGELRCLNGIIDGTTDLFDTPVGAVKVHPCCYIIGTGNPQSVNQNCTELDLSFRDRFQKVICFDAPSKEKMAFIIENHGYVTSGDTEGYLLISKMLDVYDMCVSTMSARGIKGVVSPRGMIEWSRDLSFGDDFIESFKLNILNKISSKQKEREIILESVQSLCM